MSGADYSKAQWLPSPNFWAGNDAFQLVVVHATASGGPQTGYQLATSTEFTDGQSKSVHYINDVDGTVYQIVNEVNSAWGNCCATGASPFDHVYNWNRKSISIENVKHSSDNSEPLTAAQYQSLLSLIRDICQRRNIPLQAGTPTSRGIIFHHDLDPVNKSRCPGTFPYSTFFQDLGGSPVTTATKVILNKDNCVCDVVRSNQLSENEMELCGPWSVAALKYAGPPNTGPLGTAEDIDAMTDIEVAAMGYTDPKNFPGVSVPDMERIFHDLGIHYWEIKSDWATIRKAVVAGYPVIITGFEPNIFRWTTNGWQPAYSWGPNTPANHVFPVAGFDKNGNPICYDQLSQVPDTSWPPIYDASRLNPSWAAIVQVKGTVTIPSGDPNTWPSGFNAQQTGVTPPMPTLNPNQLNAFKAEVQSLVPGLSFSSRIMGQVMSDYAAGKFRGPALCMEYLTTDWSVQGHPITAMCFAGGRYEDDGTTIRYYPYS